MLADRSSIAAGLIIKVQFRQGIYQIHRLDAYIDNAQQQVEDVAGIVDFFAPIVGVVFDTAGFAFAETDRRKG